MSLKTIVQEFCRRTNIPVPTAIIGQTDPQVLQTYSLLTEIGEDLMSRGDWQELTNEAIHTTVATESQGDIKTIASNGFSYIKDNTIWDRTSNLPIFVVDSRDWQALKSTAVTSPRYQVRIRQGELLANPVPGAGDTWSFEYISENWITDETGTTYKSAFDMDSDLTLFPEKIMLAGLRWSWKREKGLDYTEDFAAYEALVIDALSRDGMKKKLNMGNPEINQRPMIMVSPGNWNL